MNFSSQLTGFKELAEALRARLPAEAKNVLRASVSAGAAVVRVQAKNNALAMKKTGTLARAIYQKQIRELSGPEKQTFYVGVRSGKLYRKVGKKGVNKDAYYGRWVELGHFTRAPGGRIRASNRGGKGNAGLASAVQAGHVRWVAARPFLRPAFDVQKDNAVAAMGAKIRERLLKVKAKQ